jgi:hypothetical protein
MHLTGVRRTVQLVAGRLLLLTLSRIHAGCAGIHFPHLLQEELSPRPWRLYLLSIWVIELF